MYAIFNAESQQFLACLFAQACDAQLFMLDSMDTRYPHEIVKYDSERYFQLQRSVRH